LLLFLLLGQPPQKAQGLIISNRDGMKFGAIDLQVNIHRLKEWDNSDVYQDGSYDVISYRKVLPSGDCTRSFS